MGAGALCKARLPCSQVGILAVVTIRAEAAVPATQRLNAGAPATLSRPAPGVAVTPVVTQPEVPVPPSSGAQGDGYPHSRVASMRRGRRHGGIRSDRASEATQKRLDRRLEEVAKVVGGGCCRLQMPLKPALAVRETVAGHRLGALEWGGGGRQPDGMSHRRGDTLPPWCTIFRGPKEGALATVRARCTLWVYLGIKRPPGKNQKLPNKPLGIIGHHEKNNPRKPGGVLATKIFWGSMGCLGGYIVGWCTGV